MAKIAVREDIDGDGEFENEATQKLKDGKYVYELEGFRDFSLIFENPNDHDRKLFIEKFYDGDPTFASSNPFIRAQDNLHEDMANTIAFIIVTLAERGEVRGSRDRSPWGSFRTRPFGRFPESVS